MTWQALLVGPRRERALAAVGAIANDLGGASLDEGSVARGASGVALLHAYLDQAGLGGGDRADALLARAMSSMAESALASSLYHGFTGIAWAVEHVYGPGDGLDANGAIDSALCSFLAHSPWNLEHDLVFGLAGLAVYGLERARHGRGHRVLELVVDRLAECARRMPSGGLAWWMSPEMLRGKSLEPYPEGRYDATLAHGSAGVIAVLGRIVAAGVAVERARPLLDGAVEWLLAQRAERPGGAVFPRDVRVPPAPLCGVPAWWCRGDPGTAAALLGAARAVNEPRWAEIALEVAQRAAARSVSDCDVIDAGLCHGAAGLAHIYGRFWQATGLPGFRDAALEWTDRTLAMRRPGEGVGGHASWWRGAAREPDLGLLTGAAGVALALLGLATDHEPCWDRLLLLDVAEAAVP